MPATIPPARKRGLPELLAPAGSPAAFRAAVAAGADAVYLGGKRFGARKSAPNFTDDEIAEAVRYAHTRGVRVYVTVNTLIHDRELAGATEYLIWLWSIGVDAVLVQDAGLAALARTLIPGLVLHASTQMTIHNAAGVRWAAEHGFRRVVLARELGLDAVRAIAEETKDTGVGLEVFTHGALCYSYSGQCLLSSLIGGRSGNRGMCAQPCRKPWTLLAGRTDEMGRAGDLREVPLREHYLLSPKDLCLYPVLPEIAGSPVVSLKIEGRMKSPEYVAIVVSTYRRALDAIAAGTWKPDPSAVRDLMLAFNRGFTTGYIGGGRHRALMARDAPGNRGLRIGSVVRSGRASGTALVRPEGPVLPEPGDGLLIIHPDHPGETGFALNTRPVAGKDGYLLNVPRPVRAGSAVFLTASRELDARARQLVAKPPPDLCRPVPVDLDATIREDGTLTLSGTIERPDGTIVPVTCRPETILAPAGPRPITADEIDRQLRKSGGTPFVVRSLALDATGAWSAPVREINRLRREFFAAAEEQLAASYRPAMADVRHAMQHWKESTASALRCDRAHPSGPLPLRLAVVTGSPDSVREAAASGAETIFFEPDLRTPARSCARRPATASPRTVLGQALAICRPAGIPLYWKLPRIVPDRFLEHAREALPALAAEGLAGIMTDDRGTAMVLGASGEVVRVAGFSGLNIFNHAAASDAGALFPQIVLSPELSGNEIALLMTCLRSRGAMPATAVVIAGITEAMVSEDCLRTLAAPCADVRGNDSGYLAVRDDTGAVWPLWTDHACRTTIGSNAEICLLPYLPSLRSAGVAEVILDARHHPPQYVRQMTAICRQAVNWLHAHPGAQDTDPALAAFADTARRIAAGRTTTGHFLRGLRE